MAAQKDDDSLEKIAADVRGCPLCKLSRTRKNAVPGEDELSACRPYLDRQIALIKPKVICILGRTAYSSLLGGSSITASRGKIVERAGQKYFLTFHPAAVIYNKGLLSALEADLKKLAIEITKKEESKASLEDYL